MFETTNQYIYIYDYIYMYNINNRIQDFIVISWGSLNFYIRLSMAISGMDLLEARIPKKKTYFLGLWYGRGYITNIYIYTLWYTNIAMENHQVS